MGWLIALFIVVLFCCLPIGVYASYDRSGALASLVIGPVRIRLYPKRKSKGNHKNYSKSNDFEKHTQKKKKPTGSLSDFTAIADLVFEFLKDFRRKLRIRNLEFKVILADSDPYDLSVHYGLGWALLGNLVPQIDRFFVVRKRNLEVACDYTATETFIEARIDMTISLGRLLWIALYHGPRILRKYNSIVKQTKGGNVS